jgi:hypothetical protein
MTRQEACPVCDSTVIRRGKCVECGVGLSDFPPEIEELTDSEVMQQILFNVRSIRSILIFFLVLTLAAVALSIIPLLAAM